MVQGEVYDPVVHLRRRGEVYNSTAHNLTNLNHSEPIFFDDLVEGTTPSTMLFGANDLMDVVSFHAGASVHGADEDLLLIDIHPYADSYVSEMSSMGSSPSSAC